VIGWYPRLRQTVDYQQVPQMAGIQAIGLGSLFAALQ
jgi:hypothetical protein